MEKNGNYYPIIVSKETAQKTLLDNMSYKKLNELVSDAEAWVDLGMCKKWINVEILQNYINTKTGLKCNEVGVNYDG